MVARCCTLAIGHDRRLGFVVEVRAPGQQRVVDHVDGDLVLVPVLGRGEQRRRQPGVGARGRRRAARCRPSDGQRTTSPARATSSSGLAPTKPSTRVEHARRDRRREAVRRGASRRAARRPRRALPRQHHLRRLAVDAAVGGAATRSAHHAVDRAVSLTHAECAGSATRSSLVTGRSGAVVVRPTVGDPAGAVVGAADHDSGTTIDARLGRIEGQRAEGHGTACRVAPTSSSTSMRRARRARPCRGRRDRDAVRDQQRLAPPGEPTLPRVHKTPSSPARRPSRRRRRAGGSRPAAPSLRDRRPCPDDELGDAGGQRAPFHGLEARGPRTCRACVGVGQVRHRLRQVAVRGGRRTAARRCGARPCRSRRRGPSAGSRFGARRPRAARCGRRGRTTRASSAKKAPRSTKLRSANPQVTPSTRASGTGSRSASACTRGASVRAGGEHPEGEVDADGRSRRVPSSRHRSPVPQARSSTRPPTGAAGRRDRLSPPPHVHPEGHDPVDEVVARGDRVEHRPDGAAFSSPSGSCSVSIGVTVSVTRFSVGGVDRELRSPRTRPTFASGTARSSGGGHAG